MKDRLFLLILMIVGGSSLQVHASPSLNAENCGFKGIHTPENGAGLLFDRGCKNAYVLPPVAGTARIEALAKTANLGFCEDLETTRRISSTDLNSIQNLSEQMNVLIKSNQAHIEAVEELSKAAGIKKAEFTSANEQYSQASAELETLREALTTAKRDYNRCLTDNSANVSVCDPFKAAIATTEAQVKTSKKRVYDLEDKVADAKSTYLKAQAEADAESKKLAEVLKPVLEVRQLVDDVHDTVMTKYARYAAIEGATAQIVYAIEWDKLLQAYEDANPDLPVVWNKVQIKEGTLNASPQEKLDNASVELQLPAVLRSSIPGLKPPSFADANTGKLEGPSSQPSPVDVGGIAFSNSVSGSISLSLVGACPYRTGSSEYGLPQSLSSKDLAAYLVANATYTFEVKVNRGYKATYNLGNFYKRVEKEIKKGGLFSSSHMRSLIEDKQSKDWFNIEFFADSGEFQYSASEQEKIAADVKNQLIDRSLRNIARIGGGGGPHPNLPGLPLTNGAVYISSSLSNCWLWYCQAGSIVFGVLNSIFGSSSATSEFIQNNRTEATEVVKGVSFIDVTHSLTFVPKENDLL